MANHANVSLHSLKKCLRNKCFLSLRACHAIYFREINKDGSKQAYTVTDSKSGNSGKIMIFAGMLIASLPKCLWPTY